MSYAKNYHKKSGVLDKINIKTKRNVARDKEWNFIVRKEANPWVRYNHGKHVHMTAKLPESMKQNDKIERRNRQFNDNSWKL